MDGTRVSILYVFFRLGRELAHGTVLLGGGFFFLAFPRRLYIGSIYLSRLSRSVGGQGMAVTINDHEDCLYHTYTRS